MNLKIFKQNKVFLSIILTLFIIVGSVVYMTATEVYDLQLELQERNEKARLQTAKESIEIYFTKLKSQLFL